MTEQLFRQAAVDALSRSHLGVARIGIPQRVMTRALVCLLLILVLAAIVGQSDYARSVTVHGVLDEAQARAIVAKQLGDLVEVSVEEGEQIRAGQRLGRLVSQYHDPEWQRLTTLQRRQVERLKAEQQLTAESYQKQRRQLHRQVSATASLLRLALQELRLQQDKVISLATQLARSNALKDEGYLSHIDWLQLRGLVIAERQQQSHLQRQLTQLRQRYDDLKAEFDALGIHHATRRGQLAQRVAELEQQLIGQRRQREQVLYAPVSGTVTRLYHSPGSTVSPGAPIMHVSAGHAVQAATLNVPSLAAGHLSRGQHLRIAVDAYPADQYGYLRAVVQQVSDHTVAAAGGHRTYIARLAIDAESQTTDRSRRYLPGMTISASVTLERRPVIFWLAEPLRRFMEAI